MQFPRLGRLCYVPPFPRTFLHIDPAGLIIPFASTHGCYYANEMPAEPEDSLKKLTISYFIVNINLKLIWHKKKAKVSTLDQSNLEYIIVRYNTTVRYDTA